MIGQKCSPTISGIPSGNGWSTSNWQWSVSDPQDTFQIWTPTTTSPPAPQANANGSYYSGGPGTLNVQSPGGWYWDNKGVNTSIPESITCTVTVTPPTGQSNPFTVTVTQPINVWIPNWNGDATGGQMYVGNFQIVNTGTNNTYSTTDFYLMAGYTPPDIVPGSTPPVLEGNGMAWNAGVTPLTSGPTNSSGASLFGLGTLELVQLVKPEINYVDTTGTQWEDLYYGQTGLDTQYPYPSFPLNISSPPSNGLVGDDAPGLDLTANNAFLASVDDSFQDYLMFTAPGSTQPVPVGYFQWSADGSAGLTGNQTWAQFVGTTGYVSAGTVTPSGSSDFTAQNTFPMWTLIVNATTDINLPDNDISMVKKPINSSASL